MGLNNVSNYVDLIFLIILGVGVVLYAYKALYIIMAFGNKIRFKKAKKTNKFAILIPARNESRVIGDLLDAISKQTYDKNAYDVFVIVKEANDPTIEIVKNYNYNIIIDSNQTCKGDALDTALKQIYASEKQYDAFMIFDADNIPTESFLFEMNKAVDAGYDIGMGYRNSKNWDDGWVASCSGMTFSMINTFANKARAKFGVNCVYSGTGYYISDRVLSKFKGWPFKTLTEDYEISLYAIENDLKTTYVEKAEYFDEQPVSFKSSVKQRERWVKGYMQARKLYIGKIFKKIFTDKQNKISKIEQTMGVIPLAIVLVDCILYCLFQIAFVIWGLCIHSPVTFFVENMLRVIVALYLSFAIFTGLEILAERKRIKMSGASKALCIIMNPFFTAAYLPIAIKAMFSKNIGWAKIEHTRSLASIVDDEPAEDEILDINEQK